MRGTRPAVNLARLTKRLAELNAINRQGDGSCCRLALSDADRQARDLVVKWMQETRLEVQIDRVGNIFGLQPGSGTSAPVMTGSHIDTVATGGPLDGTLGVLGGLEVLQTLKEAGVRTQQPLAVAVFTNEEGVRFQPDMMGSLVFSGGLTVQQALEAVGTDGSIFSQELDRIGYAGTMPCGHIRPHAFVELHIEQGPVLDRESGAVLGAVENLQGISWQEVVIRGVSNHSGTTPMSLRHDAAYCAAATTMFVHELAHRMGGSQVATVGSLRLAPNLVNVIAREACLTIDLRNTEEHLLQSAEAEVAQFLTKLADEHGVKIQTRSLVRTEPVRFHQDVLLAIEAVASALGHPIRRITSGAGHDAQMLSRVCPTAMIFVPSIGGISHNPRESTAPEHLMIGANTLLHTLLRLAGA